MAANLKTIQIPAEVKLEIKNQAQTLGKLVKEMQDIFANADPGSSFGKSLQRGIVQAEKKLNSANGLLGKEFFSEADLAKTLKQMDGISDILSEIHVLAKGASTKALGFETQELIDSTKALKDFKTQVQDIKKNTKIGAIGGMVDKDSVKQMAAMSKTTGFSVGKTFDENYTSLTKSLDTVSKEYLELQLEAQKAKEAMEAANQAAANAKSNLASAQAKLDSRKQANVNAAQAVAGVSTGVGGASHRTKQNIIDDYKKLLDQQLVNGQWASGGEDFARIIAGWLEVDEGDLTGTATQIVTNLKRSIETAMKKGPISANVLNQNAQNILNGDASALQKDVAYKQTQNEVTTATTAVKTTENAAKNALTTLQAANNNVSQTATLLNTIRTQMAELKQLQAEYNALVDKNSSGRMDQLRQTQADAEKRARVGIEAQGRNVKTAGSTVKAGYDLQGQVQQSRIMKEQQKRLEEEGKRESEQFVNNLKQATRRWMGVQQIVNLVKRGMRQAYQDIKALDTAMTNIAVVTDMSIQELWGKIDQYMSIAQQYGVTTQGVYEVSQLYYQQGLSTNEVMAATTETLKLARIAGMDYKDAADAMTVAIRSFKMEMDDAQRVTDVYSKVAAITASDSEELATAMSKTASSAESVGSSFENTTAMLAVMVETTRESAQNLGSALKSIISRYGEMKAGKTTDEDGEAIYYNKVDQALASVGISLKDAQGQFRNFDDVIFELSKKWDSLDKNTQRYIATIMAGNRQQSRFIALVDNWERLDEVSQAAADSADAGLLQYAKTLDSLDTKLNSIKTSFQEFYMNIVNGPVIGGILEAINSLIQGFNKLGTFQGILSLVSIIRGLKVALKLVVNTFSHSFTGIIGSWKSVQTQLLTLARTSGAQRGREEANAEIQAYNATIQQGRVAGYQNSQIDLSTGQTTDSTRRRRYQGPSSRTEAVAARQKQAYNNMSWFDKRQYGMQTGKTEWKNNSWGGSKLGQGIAIGGAIGGSIVSTWGASMAEDKPIQGALVSGLGNIAQGASIGAMAGPWGALIGGIVGLISSIPAVFNAITNQAQHKLDKLKKEAEELNVTRAEKTEEYKTLANYADALKEANANKNNNAESLEEWLKLNNEVAEKYPGLISYIDSEGNAIVNLTEDYIGLAQAKKEALESNQEYYQKLIQTYQQNEKVLNSKAVSNSFNMSDFITHTYKTGGKVGYGNKTYAEWKELGDGNAHSMLWVTDLLDTIAAKNTTFYEYTQSEEGQKHFSWTLGQLGNNNNYDEFVQTFFGIEEEVLLSFIQEDVKQAVEQGTASQIFKKPNKKYNKENGTYDFTSLKELSRQEFLRALQAYDLKINQGQFIDSLNPELLENWFVKGTSEESAINDLYSLTTTENGLSALVDSNLDVQKMLQVANWKQTKENKELIKATQEALQNLGIGKQNSDGTWELSESGEALAELQKNKQAYIAALRANVSSYGSLTMLGSEYVKGLQDMAGAEQLLLQRSINVAGGVENLLNFEQTDEFKEIYGAGGYAEQLANWYANLTTAQKEIYTTFIEQSTSLSLDDAQAYLSDLGLNKNHDFYKTLMHTWYEDNISAQSRAMQKIWGEDAGIQSYDQWIKSEEYNTIRGINDRASKDNPNLYKTDQELYRDILKSKLGALRRKETDEEKINIATIIEEASTEELNAFLNFYQETDELLKGAILTRQKNFLQTRRATVGKYVSLLNSGEWKTSPEEIFGIALKDLTEEQADALSDLMLSPNFGTEAWVDEVRAFGNSIGVSMSDIDKQISQFMYQNYNTKMEMLLSQIDQTIEKSSELVGKQDKGYTFEEAQKKFQELKTLGLTDSFADVFEVTEEGLLILKDVDTALSTQYEYFNGQLTEEKEALNSLLHKEEDGSLSGLLIENESLLTWIEELPGKVIAAEQANDPNSAAQKDLDDLATNIYDALTGAGLSDRRAEEILNTIIDHGFESAEEVREFFLKLAEETGLATDYLVSQFGKINSDLGFNNFSEQFKSRETASKSIEDASLDNLRSIWDAAAKNAEIDGQGYEIWSQNSASWGKYYEQKQKELYDKHIGQLDAFGNLIVTDWEAWAEYIATSQGFVETDEAYQQILAEAKLQGQIALESYASSLEDGITEIATGLINNGEIEYSQLQDIIDTLQSRGVLEAAEYENLMNAYEALKNGTEDSYTDFLNQITQLAEKAGLDSFDTSEISAAIRDAYAELISSLASALKDGVEGTLSNEDYTNLAKRYKLSGDLRTSKGVSLSAQSQQTMAVEMYRTAQASGSTLGAGEDIWAAFKDAEGSILRTYEDINEEIERITEELNNWPDSENEAKKQAKDYLEVLKQIKDAARLDAESSIFNFMDQDWGGAGADTFDSFVGSVDKVKSALQSLKEGEYIDYKDFANMISFLNSSGQWDSFAANTEAAGMSYEQFVRSVIAHTDELGKVNLKGIAAEMGVGVDVAMENISGSMSEGLEKVAKEQIKYLQGLEAFLKVMVAMEALGSLNIGIEFDIDGDGTKDITYLEDVAENWERLASENKRIEYALAIKTAIESALGEEDVRKTLEGIGFDSSTLTKYLFGEDGEISGEDIVKIDLFGTILKNITSQKLSPEQFEAVALGFQSNMQEAFDESGNLKLDYYDDFLTYLSGLDYTALVESMNSQVSAAMAAAGLTEFEVSGYTVTLGPEGLTFDGTNEQFNTIREDLIQEMEERLNMDIGDIQFGEDGVLTVVPPNIATETETLATDFGTLEEAAVAVETAFASLQNILDNFAVSEAFREFVSLVSSLRGGSTVIGGEGDGVAEGMGLDLQLDFSDALNEIETFKTTYETFKATIENTPIAIRATSPSTISAPVVQGGDSQTATVNQVTNVTQTITVTYVEENEKPQVVTPQVIEYSWKATNSVTQPSAKTVRFSWVATNPLTSWYTASNAIPVYFKWTQTGSTPTKPTSTSTPVEKWTGTMNNISGAAYADGSIGRMHSGAELANKALVGELGPELAVYDGQYHMLGAHGAEFVKLPSDAIVFNHKQTEGILKGQFNIRGQALAEGNVTGPAYAGGASEALAQVQNAIAVWQSLINNLTVADLVGATSSGNGGGSGQSITAVTTELQEWYNLSRQIADIETEINNLIAKRENLTGGDSLKNLRQQEALLRRQAEVQKVLLDYQQLQLKRQQEHILNNSIWSQFLTFDDNGNLQYIKGNEGTGQKGALEVLADLNEMSGEEQTAFLKRLGYSYTDADGKVYEGSELVKKFQEELQAQITSYDGLYDVVHETEGTLSDIESKINDIDQTIIDNQLNVEQLIYDTLVEAIEREIDALEEQKDLLEEANKNYIDGLKNALSDEQKMYSTNQNIADRESLQRRIALLRRSGGSANEIYELEKQLDSMLQSEYFNRQEELIQNISDANDEQVRRLEEQIELQKESLEYQQEHGILWTQVYDVLSGSTEQILDFLSGNNQAFFESSLLQQKQMLHEWFDEVDFYKEEQRYQEHKSFAETNLWDTGTALRQLDSATQTSYNSLSDTDKESVKQAFLSDYATARLKEGADHSSALEEALNNMKKTIQQKKEVSKSSNNSAPSSSAGGTGSGGSGSTGSSGSGSSGSTSGSSSSSSSSYSQVSITVTSSDSSQGSPTPTSATVKPGQTFTVNPNPKPGYEFSHIVYNNATKYSTSITPTGRVARIPIVVYYKATSEGSSNSSNTTENNTGTTSGGNWGYTITQNGAKITNKSTMAKYGMTENPKTGFATREQAQAAAKAIVRNIPGGKYTTKAYRQGGLVDYTGPAFVHGSPSKPEAFLNAKQTAMISEAIKTVGDGGALDGIKATLAALNTTIKSIVNNNNIQSSSFTVAPGAVTIQVAQLNDSYDVEELSKDVMNRMVAIASKTTNRGVNRR